MKTAIIIPGMPSKEKYFDAERPSQSNSHWFPWIQRELVLAGVLAQTPEMPEPYKPDYKKWCSMFERFPIDEETILVGHSCGGGFLVRWLSENKIKVGKVVLVAPWIDPTHTFAPVFFDFQIDPELASRTQGLTIMYSTDDVGDILASVEKLKSTIKGVKVMEFTDKKHFMYRDLKTEEFPELKAILLS